MKNEAQLMSDSPYPDNPDDSQVGLSHEAARGRASAFSFLLLVLSIIFAALGLIDSLTQQWSDVAKVASVALFVGAMVSLAMGMIGDAYNNG